MTSSYRAVAAATEMRERHRVAWSELFESYDAVLAPVMPTAAIPHDTDRPVHERVTDVDGTAVPHPVAAAGACAVGASLLPVLAMPTGLGASSGLPVGVQVIGPFLGDLRLLRLGEVIAEATGTGFVPPPGT